MPDCGSCNRPLGRNNARTEHGCESCDREGELLPFNQDELGLDDKTYADFLKERNDA